MKNIQKIIIILFAALLLFACGNEYTITTKILADGSCERIITIKGDSSAIFDGEYYVPQENGWETNLEYFEEDDEYLFTAKKVFKNIEELRNEFYFEKNDDLKVNSEIKLKKQFRWFYTYFNYSETYKTLYPYVSIPASEYFSEEEFQLIKDPPDEDNLVTKEDSIRYEKFDDIFEQKMMKWVMLNRFHKMYSIISDAAKKTNNLELSESKLRIAKEKIIQLLNVEKDSLTGNDLELFKRLDNAVDDNESFEPFLQLCTEFLNTEKILEFGVTEKASIDEFYRKIEIIDNYEIFNEYTNIVQMPGLILSTNAKTIEGNNVSWSYGPIQFYITDYEMQVKSRIINFLPFIISGLFILVIIAGILAGILRKRRM